MQRFRPNEFAVWRRSRIGCQILALLLGAGLHARVCARVGPCGIVKARESRVVNHAQNSYGKVNSLSVEYAVAKEGDQNDRQPVRAEQLAFFGLKKQALKQGLDKFERLHGLVLTAGHLAKVVFLFRNEALEQLTLRRSCLTVEAN